MKLVVWELMANSGDGQLIQKLTPTQDTIIAGIRPHIYKQGSPAGSIYMEVLNDGGGVPTTVIATSDVVTLASISTAAYFHGYSRFYLDSLLAADTAYWVALRSTGYTFTDSAFVGWCSDFDLRKYDPDFSYSGFGDPLDVEMWGYKLVRKGLYP